MLARKLTAASARAVAPWWLAGGAPEPVAVYQPIGAASLAASYVNLVSPGTFDAAPGVAPTWDAATGWTFNGTSQHLTTGVIPTSGYSWFARFANATTNNGYIFGVTNGFHPNARLSFRYAIAGNQYENGGAQTTGSQYTSGVAAATTVGYRDGSPDTVTLAAWSGSTPHDCYIGCRNSLGNPGGYIAAQIAALAIYDTTLTAPQVAAVSAAMAAL